MYPPADPTNSRSSRLVVQYYWIYNKHRSSCISLSLILTGLTTAIKTIRTWWLEGGRCCTLGAMTDLDLVVSHSGFAVLTHHHTLSVSPCSLTQLHVRVPLCQTQLESNFSMSIMPVFSSQFFSGGRVKSHVFHVFCCALL